MKEIGKQLLFKSCQMWTLLSLVKTTGEGGIPTPEWTPIRIWYCYKFIINTKFIILRFKVMPKNVNNHTNGFQNILSKLKYMHKWNFENIYLFFNCER